MKNYIFFAIAILLSLQMRAQDRTKKFTVKSGKIVYEYNGVNKGSKTVYFDDYGERYYEQEKYVNETTIFGQTTTTETDHITIIVKDQFWEINHITKSNRTGKLPFYNETHQMYAGKTDAEIQQMSDDIIDSFGGERLGEEQVLGRNCEKIKVLGSVIWVYKGITLKSTTNVMDIIAGEEATSFDENINIPSSRFRAPQNVQYTNVDQQMAAYNGGNYDDSETSDDEDLIPLSYPFDDFKTAMNTFHPQGYALMMVTQDQGQYVAMFSNGSTSILSVMAMAYGNLEKIPREELGKFESFSHHGKTLRYGDMSEDGQDAKALLIPYKNHAMYIMMMCAPGKDKDSMTAWVDELKF